MLSLVHRLKNIEPLLRQSRAFVHACPNCSLNDLHFKLHNKERFYIEKTTFLRKIYFKGFHYKSVRNLSTANTQQNNDNIINKWEYKLNHFGKLVLDSQTIDCDISPIDPNDYPEQDLVTVTLQGKGEDDSVVCNGDESGVTLKQVKESQESRLQIKVPIKYNLFLTLQGTSNVSLSTLENDEIKIFTDKGSCTMSNIKSDKVHVTSKSGDIICNKTLHGNGVLKTGKSGKIVVNKPLGEELSAESEIGDINIKSLYSKKSFINTRRGNVEIGSCHQDAMIIIQQTGNLSIGTLDGSLLASVGHGDSNIHVTNHKDLQVISQSGDINIKLMKNESTQVSLTADNVDISSDLDTSKLFRAKEGDQQHVTRLLGAPLDHAKEEHTSIVAKTGRGDINISKLDWIHTLGIKIDLKE